MIDISTLEVSGFKGAILGMRNPFKNRDKSDSGVYDADSDGYPIFTIGAKDLELAQKLVLAGGDDDAKFMRMIHVQADVNAPLYWWKEYDTYKVATVANSESTMHTIHKKAFEETDFSREEFLTNLGMKRAIQEKEFTETDFFYNESEVYDPDDDDTSVEEYLFNISIIYLNNIRESYLKAMEDKDTEKAKYYWRNMIQLLPESYMQKRTIDLNYQTLRRIYFARMNHKLDEWHKFCDWIKTLPYAEELITYKPDETVY